MKLERVVLVSQLSRDDIPHQPFDWIFIDSDHSYGACKFDTEWAMPMLAREGLMIWHDYGVPSQFLPQGPIFGVKKYLDEFSATHPVTVFQDPLHASSIAFMQKGAE